MSKGLLRIFVLVLTIAAHGIAFLQFQQQLAIITLPPEFGSQFQFLLALSLSFALITPFTSKPHFTWLLLILRGGALILMNMPFGNYLGITATLITALIVEANVYCSFKAGIICSAILVAAAINSRVHPVKAWGLTLPAPSGMDLLFFGIYAGFITVFSAIFNFQVANQISVKELNRRLDEATLQLARANSQLQEYAVMAEREAVQNERKRFAREIHDTLAYTLTNLIMMSEAAKDLVDGEKTVLLGHLSKIHDLARAGSLEVRRAIQALRPVELTEVSGLLAVYRLVRTFREATQINVELNLGNVPQFLGEEADLTVYRLVQEGITNALRHGKASEIELSFSLLSGGVCILIKDNGIGSNNLNEGYGLTGMRERIERLGGQLTASNRPEGGFMVSAWIPLKEESYGKD
ncbi:MAG: sensor histidine kinase [Bacillota bacterium]